jgi:hypothetical protein
LPPFEIFNCASRYIGPFIYKKVKYKFNPKLIKW